MTRRTRLLLGLGAILLALPALAYAALLALVSSDAIRPRLVAAVEAATGRAFALSGPVGVRLSLVPTITLDGPTLANLPGGSRPDMLRARRVEAELALLPLLSRRIEVRRLALIAPDLLLETDAEGRPNWRLAPSRPEVPPAADAAPAAPPRPMALDVREVTLEDARVTLRTAAGAEILDIPRLALRPAADGTRLEGRVLARGIAATVTGGTGPVAALGDGTATPWPFRLALSAEGLNAEVTGTLDLPVAPAGWRARLALTADGAPRLAPLLPGRAVPPALAGLRGLSAVAEAGGADGLGAFHVAANEWSLPAAFRGLALGPVQVSIPAGGGATLTGTARLGDLALALSGTGPALAVLRDPAAPFPVSLDLASDAVSLSVRAALPPTIRAGNPAGAAGTVALRAADAGDLARRLGATAPALHDVTLSAPWAVTPDAVQVADATLAAREAAGRATLTIRAAAPVPAVEARVALDRLDLDALRPAAPPAAPAPVAAPAAPNPAAPRRLIPDAPRPLHALRALPLSLAGTATVGTLRVNGGDWRDVAVTVQAGPGRLVLDPVSATSPGGPLSGALTAEAAGAVSLALRTAGPGADLAPLLEALGAAPSLRGRARLDLALRGGGETLRALLGTLDGTLALSTGEATLDPALVARLGGPLRGLVPDAALGNAANLRCLDARLAVAAGVARIATFALRSPVLAAAATGEANLRDETLALRVEPTLSLGGTAVRVPIGVGGTFAAPSVSVDRGGAAVSAAGLLGALARRSGDPDAAALGALAEALAAPAAADCAVPAAEARPPGRRPDLGDVFRGILGR